jgi:secretion/DNA translocation related CpaE-like protein
MTQSTHASGPHRPPVVLAGGTQFVRDQVARACAAAGVAPLFVSDVGQGLAGDPLLLLVAADQHVDGLSGQRDVIVVGAVDDEQRVWGVASGLPSSSVVILPQGAGWLAECIGRRLNPAATGAIVGVLGTAGGCGVSTLAYWCARSAADRGRTVVVIDGQPLGGGMDLALGLEGRPGVRWNDLADIRGTLSADQFAAALPVDRGVALLSHTPRSDQAAGRDGEMMRTSGAVMDASRSAFDVSVIDLGSAAAADRTLTAACDHLLLVVPARHRSVAAAPSILQSQGSATTVVVRGPVMDGLDAWVVADLLGRPGPLPYVPFVRGVPHAEATGRTADLPVPRKARRVIETISREWEQTR